MTRERRYCTVPSIFGLDDWFKARFNDLCEAHDDAYQSRTGQWAADKALMVGMYNRGYWWLVPPTFLFLMTVGTVYYYLVD